MWSFWVQANLCRFFFTFYGRWDPNYREGKGLTHTQFGTCLKLGPGFPTSYVMAIWFECQRFLCELLILEKVLTITVLYFLSYVYISLILTVNSILTKITMMWFVTFYKRLNISDTYLGYLKLNKVISYLVKFKIYILILIMFERYSTFF